jgi:uncharacterized membrane protein (UPF0127 family)
MIANKSKNTVLARRIFLADNPLSRMKGLLGRKALGVSEAMVIKPCNAVHTFFMRFPIDILFIGKDNRVIRVVCGLKPFRFSPACFSAHFVIELPAGSIQDSCTTPGDQLSIE